MLPTYAVPADRCMGRPSGERDPLHEDAITAGEALGWRRVSDLNETDEERIGYAMATVRNGVRVSAAHALLHPIIARPNLTVWVLALTAATSLGVFKPGRPFRRQPKSG